MKTITRPPDPAYYRRFVAGWCGGCDQDCLFSVVPTAQAPRPTLNGRVCVVGAQWLERQRIPREALEP